MLRWSIVLGLLSVLLIPPCIAQMTPEEAQERLAERQAAATQPDNMASEIITLKAALADQAKLIKKLQGELSQLRADNISLKKVIAANPTITPPAGQKLAKGMTKAQLLDVLGKPTSDETEADGSEHMQWNRIIQKQPAQTYSDPDDADAAFQQGVLDAPQVTKKTAWTLGHLITADLENGRVTDFSNRQQN